MVMVDEADHVVRVVRWLARVDADEPGLDDLRTNEVLAGGDCAENMFSSAHEKKSGVEIQRYRHTDDGRKSMPLDGAGCTASDPPFLHRR